MNRAENAKTLILWDADFVLHWLQRDETYARLRARANASRPALTVQGYAEVLRSLLLRPGTAARLDETIEEIQEHLLIVDLTAEHAPAYAKAADACRNTAPPDVKDEAWFAWQVALCRSEGHRIMTKAPQRYTGLVARAHLA